MACHLTAVRLLCDIHESFDYISEHSGERKKARDFDPLTSAPYSPYVTKHEGSGDVIQECCAQWPSSILASVSPYADYAVIASRQKFVIYASSTRSESASQTPTCLECIFRGILPDSIGDDLTSVLCMPVASHRKTAQGRPDWTCFFVGTSLGSFKVIAEDGSLLVTQQFHNEPVLSIKCRTFRPSRFSEDVAPCPVDEVLILYPTAVVLLEGFDLFHNIQAARSSLAHLKAKTTQFQKDAWLNARALIYRKFLVDGASRLTDCDGPIVASASSLFDQLKTASLLGGFGASLAQRSPVLSSFVAAGAKPFVGFYYVTEKQPHLMQTARLVASRLKSALFSMAGVGSSAAPSQPDPLNPAEGDPLPLRFGFPDKNREALAAVLSPRKNLTAVVDNLGRVTLIDNVSGIALRMWKGYREAEVAWIESFSSSASRSASFLVIYSPRRGLLEVWAAQQGPRVAAFNVSKGGKLVGCSSYRMLGLNEAAWAQARDGGYQHQAFFLDADGTIYSISVPLHLIDCEKNKKKAEDLHALGKIRRLLGFSSRKSSKRVTADDLEAVLEALEKFETPELLENALSFVMGQHSDEAMKKARSLWSGQSSNDCDHLISIIERVLSALSAKSAAEISPEAATLLGVCVKLRLATELYRQLLSDKQTPKAKQKKKFTWEEVLKLTGEEEERVRKLIAWNASTSNCAGSGKTVRFDLEEPLKLPLTLPEFSARFKLDSSTSKLEIVDNPASEAVHSLGWTLIHDLESLGSVISRFETEGVSDSDVCLPLPRFLPFAVKFLLSLDMNESEDRFTQMCTLLKRLLELLFTNTEEVVLGTLREIHAVVLDSTAPLTPYLIALVCRSTLAGRHREKVMDEDHDLVKSMGESLEEVTLTDEEQDASKDADTSWEEVSAEEVGWNLMCSHLYGLAVLTILVQSKPGVGLITLNKYLGSGEACICEFLSRWCVSSGLDVEEMKHLGMIMRQTGEAETGDDVKTVKQMLILELKKEFGDRLDPDIILMNCGYEWASKWSESGNHDFLSRCIECLDAVDSPMLCSRVQSFVWRLFVSQPFAGAAMLLERTGCRMPRDRILKRELSMEVHDLGMFLDFVRRFLALLLRRIGEDEGERETSAVKRKRDQTRWRDSECLAELVTAEKPVNPVVVNNHFILCFVLESSLKFGIKGLKPLSLFSQTSKKTMFTCLTSPVTLSYLEESDTAITMVRTEFLARLVTEAVRSLPDFVPGADPRRLETEYERQVELWIGFCLETASLNIGWGDVDELRRHVVTELYSRGMDVIGEKLSIGVVDRDRLATAALTVAGKRIGGLARAAEVSAELTPTLSRWIKSLDPPDNWFGLDVPIEVTEKLVAKVVGWLDRDKRPKDAALADALLRSIKAVGRISNS